MHPKKRKRKIDAGAVIMLQFLSHSTVFLLLVCFTLSGLI